MIQVERNTDGSYTVKVEAIEHRLLQRIAAEYSIPMREAMGASIHRGLEDIDKLILAARSSKAIDKDEQGTG